MLERIAALSFKIVIIYIFWFNKIMSADMAGITPRKYNIKICQKGNNIASIYQHYYIIKDCIQGCAFLPPLPVVEVVVPSACVSVWVCET